MAITQQPKKVEQLPPENVITLWDMYTGQVVKVARRRFELLSKNSDKKTALGFYNDFSKRYYEIDKFGGQKIDLFHIVSGKKIDLMTLELFQEIQRRNPPIKMNVYDGGQKISNEYRHWEKYLTTIQEAKDIKARMEAPKEQTIEEKIQEEVRKALSGVKPVKPDATVKMVDDVTNVNATSTEPVKGRRGRKAKTTSNE